MLRSLISRRARRGRDKKRRKKKEKERLARRRTVSGREGGKAGRKEESWEGRGEATAQRCGMSEERKWKARGQEMERGKEEMERGKEDRGKGKRLRRASGSEASEMYWVNVFVDTVVL